MSGLLTLLVALGSIHHSYWPTHRRNHRPLKRTAFHPDWRTIAINTGPVHLFSRRVAAIQFEVKRRFRAGQVKRTRSFGKGFPNLEQMTAKTTSIHRCQQTDTFASLRFILGMILLLLNAASSYNPSMIQPHTSLYPTRGETQHRHTLSNAMVTLFTSTKVF